MIMLSRLNFVLAPHSLTGGRRLVSTTASLNKWGDVFVPKKSQPDECPPDYKEYPERDLVNFPRPKRYLFSPKVRMGMFPESWFNFMYNKTGVTGPYLLGGGVTLFLLNKELYIITPEHNYVVAFIIAMYILVKGIGAPASKYLYELDCEADDYEANHNRKKNQIKDCLEKSLDVVTRCEGWTPMLFQAQRDQVFMVMEEEYRRRLAEYRTAVKRKMDYLVEYDDTKKRFQRKHVIDWVVDQVRSSIDEKVQNAAFAQCVSHLKTLSTRAHV